MKTFTPKDIEDYYDQTEVHYRMFWKLGTARGLHYGIWEWETKNLDEAILNTNLQLMKIGGIKSSDVVLDCGCGIGGSAIFLAKQQGCRVTGITLSARQVETARNLAKSENVGHLVNFERKNYLDTQFPDNSFDIIWAIESFGSSPDKSRFFQEMYRILKPGGKILFADTFKPHPYTIDNEPDMLTMLNGWAIADILSVDELNSLAETHNFSLFTKLDASEMIRKSVVLIYRAALLGMIGTKLYNLFRKASPFSKIHYKTGIAQKKTYKQGKWGYYLLGFKSMKK